MSEVLLETSVFDWGWRIFPLYGGHAEIVWLKPKKLVTLQGVILISNPFYQQNIREKLLSAADHVDQIRLPVIEFKELVP